MQAGCVYLVGAGPGDPDLLTVKGHRYLQQADVIVYDRLVSHELLALAPPSCERVYAGKRKHLHAMSQTAINQLLIERARAGLRVVRLKGGDPFVFGRGGEECEALTEARIGWEVVPGITAALGASAGAGLPLTHRDHTQAVTLVTAHRRSGQVSIDWALILHNQTVVIYMGFSALAELIAGLQARGKPANTPFTVVARATMDDQLVLHGTLGTILAHPDISRVSTPALLILHNHDGGALASPPAFSRNASSTNRSATNG